MRAYRGVVCKKITFILHKKDSFFRYKCVLFKKNTEALKMEYKTVVLKYNPRAKKWRKKWKKPQTNMPKKAGICLRFPLLFRQKPYSYSKSPILPLSTIKSGFWLFVFINFCLYLLRFARLFYFDRRTPLCFSATHIELPQSF